jgi:outer membrane protein TolC
MSRQIPLLSVVLTVTLVALTGCQPQQPFYFFENGDMAHYKGMATEVEYPDLQECSSPEVDGSIQPYSLRNRDAKEPTDLKLEEAIHIALTNNKVMRSIGGQVTAPPDFIARNPELVPTIWDPAIVESNPQAGVEAALSAFDAQLHSVAQWQKFNEPRNTTAAFDTIFPSVRQDDNGTFQNQIRKVSAGGGTFALSHDILYTDSNSPTRNYHSDWTTQLRAEVRQPLLQGNGVQVNRITGGPGAVPGVNRGVMIARINTDIALADFEMAVRNLVLDVETAYWELYYAYHNLETMKAGRESGLRNWQEAYAKSQEGMFSNLEDAQARQAYYEFRTAMERALVDLYQTEAKLRYVMGLSSTDGRIFRPADEPTTARISFEWNRVLAESMERSVELRENRWIIKKRELELIAAKNFLLPKLDLVAMYQWQGLGNRLADADGGSGDYRIAGSNSYQSLTNGGFADWMTGITLDFPIGNRRELSGVRNAQLALARQRARLQESELEISHQVAHALREMESNLLLSETNYNRWIAAKEEVRVVTERVRLGKSGRASGGAGAGSSGTWADVLDANRRLATARAGYYRSLVSYNENIATVHFRKGTLLEYNGVTLTEGPWPAKAYFDAERRARARDASLYLDYGFTRPKVVSRGPAVGQGDGDVMFEGATPNGVPTPAGMQPDGLVEPVAPIPEPKPEDNTRNTSSAFKQPQLAGTWSTGGQGPVRRAGKKYDLGSLDLGSLADKASNAKQADGVRTVSYEEPARGNKTSTASQTTRLKWADSSNAGTHEPVANPPSAEADRSPADWKRLER